MSCITALMVSTCLLHVAWALVSEVIRQLLYQAVCTL